MSAMENAASMLERIGSGVLPAPGEANRMASELRALAAQCWPAGEPGHGLSSEQVAALLADSLKPEEIGGDAVKQHERVGELLHWFARLTKGMANPKWTAQHASELAYYIATGAQNRHVDVEAVRQAAFLEGCNITAQERATLERIGAIKAAPPSQPVTLPADLAAALAELHAAMGTPATVGDVGDSPYLGVVKLAAKRLSERSVALPDQTLCRFYGVDSWEALVAAQEEHVLKLQDAARRNVKPWEDTFPPTLLPKYLRDSGLAAAPSTNSAGIGSKSVDGEVPRG